MSKLRDQVHEFHVVLGQAERTTPGVPEEDVVRLRARLVLEEAFEFAQALFSGKQEQHDFETLKRAAFTVVRNAAVKVDFPDAIDALADIDYVVEGSRLVFGVDGGPIADEVHQANMTKLGGGKDAGGKFLKPAGWKPPDIEGKLREQGWEEQPIELPFAWLGPPCIVYCKVCCKTHAVDHGEKQCGPNAWRAEWRAE